MPEGLFSWFGKVKKELQKIFNEKNTRGKSEHRKGTDLEFILKHELFMEKKWVEKCIDPPSMGNWRMK